MTRASPTSCALVIANADTALTSAANGGYPELNDNGVPFGYIDREPKNNFRYFYSVTAFDVNSFQSGPSSLESPRVAKPVTPSVTGLERGGAAAGVGPLRTGRRTARRRIVRSRIDAATGRFNGTPPATNGVSGAFAPLIPALLPALNLTATIDSVNVWYSLNPICNGVTNFGGGGSCYIFYVTFEKDGVKTPFTTVTPWPIWSSFDGIAVYEAQLGAQPVNIDPTAAAKYGIPGTVTGNAAVGSHGAAVHPVLQLRGPGGPPRTWSATTPRPCAGRPDGLRVGGITRWLTLVPGRQRDAGSPDRSGKVGSGLTGVDTVWAPINHVDQDPTTPTGRSRPPTADHPVFGYGWAGVSREADVVVKWGAGERSPSPTSRTTCRCRSAPSANASYGFVTDADGERSDRLGGLQLHAERREWWIDYGLGFGPADMSEAVSSSTRPTVAPVSTSYGQAAATGPGGIGLYINGERYIFAAPRRRAAGRREPSGRCVPTRVSYARRWQRDGRNSGRRHDADGVCLRAGRSVRPPSRA